MNLYMKVVNPIILLKINKRIMKTEELPIEDISIGTVTIRHNKNSKKVYTTFIPTMQVTNRAEMPDLKSENCTDEQFLKEQVNNSISSWFAKTTEIELADREKYTIQSKEVSCKKYSTSEVKEIIYDISLVKL